LHWAPCEQILRLSQALVSAFRFDLCSCRTSFVGYLIPRSIDDQIGEMLRPISLSQPVCCKAIFESIVNFDDINEKLGGIVSADEWVLRETSLRVLVGFARGGQPCSPVVIEESY
jgi:hypothetical protein